MARGKHIKADFLNDTKGHKLTVVQDSGLFRHLTVKRPESGVYGYNITTWPGYLCISGDMGCYVFARLDDMFEFFRSDKLEINAGYWGEKLQAVAKTGRRSGDAMEFNQVATANSVLECWKDDKKEYRRIKNELSRLLHNDCEDDRAAMEIMQGIDGLHDAWDYLVYDYTLHFQWCLYAIVYAIQQYDKAKSTAPSA